MMVTESPKMRVQLVEMVDMGWFAYTVAIGN